MADRPMRSVPLDVLRDLQKLLEENHKRTATYRIVIIELVARGVGIA